MKKHFKIQFLAISLFTFLSNAKYGQISNCAISTSNNQICIGDSTVLSVGFSNPCNSFSTSLQNGLIGWWPFCGDANDQSGNGNHGTVNGASLTSDRFGISNKAYSFDGVNDYILVNNSNSLNPSEISINCWIYANHNDICILEKGNVLNATQHSYSITHNDIWNIQRGLKSSFSNGNCVTTSNNTVWGNIADVPNNTWVMLTVQINNTGLVKHFLNGQLIYSFSSGVPLSTCNSASSTLRFGGPHWNSDPEWFDGKIDDIGIWNRVLTIQEIQELYNQGNQSVWWSDGTTNLGNIQVQPTQTTSFSVTVSDGINSCTDSITIQVNNPQINAGSDLSICDGETATLTATGAYTYAWDNGVVNGQPFTPAVEGYYTVIGTDTLGCSSSASVYVDLLQPTTSTISPIICDSYTAPDNAIYLNSGIYTAVIPNSEGCDSTITINLTLNKSTESSQTISEIDSFTWPINGQTYYESGIYNAVIPNSVGCDSIVTLNLNLEFTGILESKNLDLKIVPNPVDVSFTVFSNSLYLGNKFIITNLKGESVLEGYIKTSQMNVDCSGLSKGVYLFKLDLPEQNFIRFIKN